MFASIDSLTHAEGWVVLCLELPALVLAIGVVAAVTIALCRARPEDIPQVFSDFVRAFGYQLNWFLRPGRRRPSPVSRAAPTVGAAGPDAPTKRNALADPQEETNAKA
ncbi:hypothetical protein [Nocardia sp. 852002-20019_SCH5090214]|uniref:hypothetical protein n=1 Tax=Nocardia sp. 852002-20019_SCH5090214 TaxID=1834087 RepID=UPI000B22F6C7|nr:hypothetical protein [Nocardia sp. 852002-20019_SCH5090214]